MSSHNLAFVCALFVFVGVCFADVPKKFELRLTPTLPFDDHYYRVAINCSNFHCDSTSAKTPDEIATAIDYDQIEFELPQKYQGELKIFVQIKNKTKETDVWGKNFSKKVDFKEGKTAHQITFGNHFKLTVAPPLPDLSNRIYRVDIYCALGTSQRNAPEFKSYTKSGPIVVVLNSEETKCKNNEYDIQVWEMQIGQIKKNTPEKRNDDLKMMSSDTKKQRKSKVQIPNNENYRFDFMKPEASKLIPSPNCQIQSSDEMPSTSAEEKVKSHISSINANDKTFY